MTLSVNKNKRKPQGEFVWVLDGKTEYMGQLVDPLATVKKEGMDGENLKVELQWTHNGLFEWVSVDRVRIELSPMGQRPRGTPESRSPPETNNKKRRAPSSAEKEENSEHQKERISPEKVIPEEGKSDVLEKVDDASEEKAQDCEVTNSDDAKEDKQLEEKDAAEDTKEAKMEDLENKEPERTMDEPPTKKRKTESGNATYAAGGFFASLGQQVVDAKNAFVSGFQEIYKELLGPQ